MPKKYTPKALLTKPVATPSHLKPTTVSPNQNETRKPSVNDLIRESRRLQFGDEPRNSSSVSTASVPPHVRAVLDLPPPPEIYGRIPGPRRQRRIPGPPPPRSWLKDSIHAPQTRIDSQGENGRRLQIRQSNLPEGNFPDSRSLQHLILKQMALNWDWHSSYDAEYMTDLPVAFKECLLSYLAIYGESKVNPLRILFLSTNTPEDWDEVRRLDLGNACGSWTTSKRLLRDLTGGLGMSKVTYVESLVPTNDASSRMNDVAESWDQEDDNSDIPRIPSTLIPITAMFKNLRHLSLAVSPGSVTGVSWHDLLSLSNSIPTLTSLSLAYWPIPTFTPNAASVHARVRNPCAGSIPEISYGGTDFYTAFDNNWREAAGILRTLSKSLYCLRWLDLTGCGEWFPALTWKPSSQEDDDFGPQWNGSWRSLTNLILAVGWAPIAPKIARRSFSEESWDVDDERVKYLYRKDIERHNLICVDSQVIVVELRNRRKSANGKWLEIETSDSLTMIGT